MKRSAFDRRFDVVVSIILGLLLFVTAYPLYFVIISSVSEPVAVMRGQVTLWPVGFSLEAYDQILKYNELWIGYRNTIIYVVADAIVSVFTTMITGYAISRKGVPGMRGLQLFMVFTMYFSGGLIPTYQLIRGLGLTGNPMVLIILSSVSVGNIIVTRSFIKSNIPEELFEAASIDGCSHFRYLFAIVVPLSQAILAVILLNNAVGMWNSWFSAMIYLKDSNQMPLQFKLRTLLLSASKLYAETSEEVSLMGDDGVKQQQMVEAMKYGIIIVSSLPILCLYPFLQKYFVKGITMGSLKG